MQAVPLRARSPKSPRLAPMQLNRLRAFRHIERSTHIPLNVLQALEATLNAGQGASLINASLVTAALPNLWQIMCQLLVPQRGPAKNLFSSTDLEGRRTAMYNLNTRTSAGASIAVTAEVITKTQGSQFKRRPQTTRVRLSYKIQETSAGISAEVHQEFYLTDVFTVATNVCQMLKLVAKNDRRALGQPRDETLRLAAASTIFL